MEVVHYDDPVRAAELRTAWEALLRKCPHASAALAYDYVMCGWETLPKDPEVRFALVTVWRDGELACVWPLYTQREGWIRIACHLGSGDRHEYAGPLVEDGAETAEVLQAALGVVRILADVARIYNVRAPTQISAALHEERMPKRTSTIIAPIVEVGGLADLDIRLGRLSKKLRAQLRRDRRHLGALGDLQFRQMSGSVDGRRCIGWIFDQKRAWLTRRDLGWSYILKPEIRRFFEIMASRPAHSEPTGLGVAAFALTLGDVILAACILLLSGDRVEFHTTAFDTGFADRSPGVLMIEDCVRLAFARGVDFDFRLVQQAYKERWTDRLDHFDTFHLGCTPRGVAAIRMEAVQQAIHRARARYGPRIKAWLRGRRSSAVQPPAA